MVRELAAFAPFVFACDVIWILTGIQMVNFRFLSWGIKIVAAVGEMLGHELFNLEIYTIVTYFII